MFGTIVQFHSLLQNMLVYPEATSRSCTFYSKDGKPARSLLCKTWHYH